jgi:hypothetical protein
MFRSPAAVLLAILVASAVAPGASAESIDSPIYKSWARHKVGTTITHVSVTEARGRKIETTTTYKLLELTDEKAVIETTVVSDATGTKVEQAPTTSQVKREFVLLAGVKKGEIGKPRGVLKRGEETLSVAGRRYKAHWYDTKGQTEVGESFTRTWLSDEVPQKILKSVTRVPAGGLTTTLELTEIKTP